MKNYLLIISLTLFLFSCQEDEKTEPTSPASSFRISSMVEMNEGLASAKNDFYYQDDLITEIKYYAYLQNSDDWHLIYNFSFEYNDDRIIAISKDATGELFSKIESTVIDGRMHQQIIFSYQDNAWSKLQESNYYFSGSMIDSSVSVSYSSDQFSLSLKRIYTYENEKPILSHLYRSEKEGIWEFIKKSVYTYAEQTFEFITYSYLNNELTEDWKEINTLNGEFITKKESYMFWEGEYWELSNEKNYIYNEQNLLSELQYSSTNDHSTTQFHYESGSGNYTWFLSPESVLNGHPTPQKKSSKHMAFPFTLP